MTHPQAFIAKHLESNKYRRVILFIYCENDDEIKEDTF